MKALKEMAFIGLILVVVLIAARYVLWWCPDFVC